MTKLAKLKATGAAVAAESMGKRTKAERPAIKLVETLAGVDPQFVGVDSAGMLRAIPLDMIMPDPNQPRKMFDPAELEELARTMESVGQVQPAEVYWSDEAKKYVIIFGERRWRACRIANRPTLECRVRDAKPSPEDLRVAQLIENRARANLGPMEEAKAFQIILDELDIKPKDLAERLGINPGTISKSLALVKTSEVVQRLVESGELDAASAYEISKIPKSEQSDMATEAADRRWTRARVIEEVGRRREIVKRPKAEPATVPFTSPPTVEEEIAKAKRDIERSETKPDGGEVAPRNFRDKEPVRALVQAGEVKLTLNDDALEKIGDLSITLVEPVQIEGLMRSIEMGLSRLVASRGVGSYFALGSRARRQSGSSEVGTIGTRESKVYVTIEDKLNVIFRVEGIPVAMPIAAKHLQPVE